MLRTSESQNREINVDFDINVNIQQHRGANIDTYRELMEEEVQERIEDCSGYVVQIYRRIRLIIINRKIYKLVPFYLYGD